MTQTAAKPHLSPTQLEMFGRCPRQYAYRYVDGLIVPPGIALLVGGGLHKGAEHNFRQKIDSHQDLPTGQIVEAAVAGFEAQQAAGYLLSPDEESRGIATVLGEAKDQVATLATVHAQRQAPDYQPVAVEHATRITLVAATHDLLGITDLRDDKRRVTDLKTAARKMSPTAADANLQLTIYAAAQIVDTGEPPSEVRLDVITKTKKPDRQVITSHRDRRDFAALVNRINYVLAAIHAGTFPPCNTGAWQCSPRWCGFFNQCDCVNSERRIAAESNGE